MANVVFGPYELIKKIAVGGMGEVFTARRRGLEGFDKIVCVKRLLESFADDPAYIEMFLNEARLASRLSHPNIVQVFDAGEVEGRYFVAMEYVEGVSLSALMKGECKGFTLGHKIDVLSQLCTALSHAHAQTDSLGHSLGIIHRDVNPKNVLLSRHGEVKLIDFGVARSQLARKVTEAGTIKGTMEYVSPEQVLGDPLDHRSDIFSLGVLMYELLTGTNPFARSTVLLVLEAIVNHVPQLPSSHRPELGRMDAIVQKALEKTPARRFRDCREFALALADVRASLPVATNLGTLIASQRVEHDVRREGMAAKPPGPQTERLEKTVEKPRVAVQYRDQFQTIEIDVEARVIRSRRTAEPLDTKAKMDACYSKAIEATRTINCARYNLLSDIREAPAAPASAELQAYLKAWVERWTGRFHKSIVVTRTASGKMGIKDWKVSTLVFSNLEVAEEYVAKHPAPP